MSPPLRIALFLALLVLVFAGAALAGSALGPEPEETEPQATHGGGEAAHGDGGSAETDPGPAGLAAADGELRLELLEAPDQPGRRGELSFRVADLQGEAVSRFERTHERPMHVIVVRRDGAGFQHLHPRMDDEGVWTTALLLPEPGSWRIFADFRSGGADLVLASDLVLGEETAEPVFPAPASRAHAGDGYRVELAGSTASAGEEVELDFEVTRNGAPVEVEPYLGASGHLVALREGDLAYLHTHPAGEHDDGAHGSSSHHDAISFATTFPSAGTYALYLQFKHEREVRTARLTLEVEE